MHLSHIGTPKHEGIGVLQIIVTTHGLVSTEGTHKTTHRRGHAMAGIGIQIIRTEAGLEQLRGRITFPHRPLPGTEHPHRSRSLFLERLFPLLGHDIKGLIPTDRGKFAFLVVLAICHA